MSRHTVAVAGYILAAAFSSTAMAGPITLSTTDEDAACRVMWAEAGREPIAGRAAVLGVIINRVAAGMAPNVQAAIDAKNAFEPATTAGGWRNLPATTEVQMAECLTILSLSASGHLSDPSNGGRFFQNPVIVAARAKAGKVKPSLVNFGGMPVVAELGHHRFYRGAAAKAADSVRPELAAQAPAGGDTVFLDTPSSDNDTIFLP